jgi:LacI family transcriptional regulator
MPDSSTPLDNPKPTINDVAARAGVSKKTVSRVINGAPGLRDLMREKVQTAIAELGFVPNPQARALALRRNFLIVLFHDNPNAQTVLNFQNGVLQAIKDTDFALVVRPVERTSDGILEDVQDFLERQRPWGAMLLPPISERDDLAALLRNQGVRYVRIGSALLDTPEHCVASNDQQVVEFAVSQLIAKGHRDIGFVRGPDGFRSALERESGFIAAIRAAKLALPPKRQANGNYRFESGVLAGQQLLDRPDRPTAVFASNDEMAAGVMHCARALGIKVPEELSIVGFDDSPTASHLWPPLTTVRWPIYEMGQLAAQKLLPEFFPNVDGKNLPVTLESTLIERASVSTIA